MKGEGSIFRDENNLLPKKSQDGGAFGREVIELLKKQLENKDKQLEEKDFQIRQLLEELGKNEVYSEQTALDESFMLEKAA